jgi:starch synthase
MHVVHVAPEFAPHAKVGGLGDVVGSLPVAQSREGVRVSVIVPGYKPIMERLELWSGITGRTGYAIGGEDLAGTVHRFDHGGVDAHAIWQPRFFDRPGIYGDSHGSYDDNGDRFAWFAGAALNVARLLDPPPDVLVCHDWPAALVPVLLRAHPVPEDPLSRSASVLVIHNLAHQGIFRGVLAARIGLPRVWSDGDRLGVDGNVNMLKGAISSANLVVTVSPTYARQILSPSHGCGLDRDLRSRARDLAGILNGIDVEVWNPVTDTALAARYGPDEPRGKLACKVALQSELGLRVDERLPLFGAVTRIDAQNGVDLIGRIAGWLVESHSQLAILGTGQAELLEELRGVAHHWRQSIAIVERFDESLAHRIYAGSDFFLMPSRFEPCGLGQLVALRYGSLPIVHRTGGLADTVRDTAEAGDDGNGFTFDVPDAQGLRWACERALKMFHDEPERLAEVRARAMREDLSWARSAREHLRVMRIACLRERARAMD